MEGVFFLLQPANQPPHSIFRRQLNYVTPYYIFAVTGIAILLSVLDLFDKLCISLRRDDLNLKCVLTVFPSYLHKRNGGKTNTSKSGVLLATLSIIVSAKRRIRGYYNSPKRRRRRFRAVVDYNDLSTSPVLFD
jgi:hypothetical protein